MLQKQVTPASGALLLAYGTYSGLGTVLGA